MEPFSNSITSDLISCRGTMNVYLNDNSHNNVVAGDFIGTDSTGGNGLLNRGSGVLIDTGSFGNTIGGTTAAAADVISFNQDDGVQIEASDQRGRGRLHRHRPRRHQGRG